MKLGKTATRILDCRKQDCWNKITENKFIETKFIETKALKWLVSTGMTWNGLN
jgi:hypothetical protein